MLSKFFSFGSKNNSSKSFQKNNRKQIGKRNLRLENLENRELLNADATFAQFSGTLNYFISQHPNTCHADYARLLITFAYQQEHLGYATFSSEFYTSASKAKLNFWHKQICSHLRAVSSQSKFVKLQADCGLLGELVSRPHAHQQEIEKLLSKLNKQKKDLQELYLWDHFLQVSKQYYKHNPSKSLIYQ